MTIKLPFTHYHNCAGALGFLNIPLLILGIKGSFTEQVLIGHFSLQCLAKSWPGVLLSLLTLNLIVILSKLTLLKNKGLLSIEYSRHLKSSLKLQSHTELLNATDI